MASKAKIEDIAALTGVSIGTVDRVLHGRPGVSARTKAKVEAAIASLGYIPSLHLSAISMKRTFKIVAVIPDYSESGYWEKIVDGIRKAQDEFADFKIEVPIFTYNQYDLGQCESVFQNALEEEDCDAYIIGPSFEKLTHSFVGRLTKPYVLVDAPLVDSDALSSIYSDNLSIGHLVAKLLCQTTPADSQIALLHIVRTKEVSINTKIRRQGFLDYFENKGQLERLTFGYIKPNISAENDRLLDDFFAKHPNIKGIAVLASKGYVVADYLERKEIKDIRLVCMDALAQNVDALHKGYISYLIGQRPEEQSLIALKSLLLYFIQRKQPAKVNLMPIDIVTEENVQYYK